MMTACTAGYQATVVDSLVHLIKTLSRCAYTTFITACPSQALQLVQAKLQGSIFVHTGIDISPIW